MAYASLPVKSAAVVADKTVPNPLAEKLPKLKLSPDLTRWLSGLSREVDRKTTTVVHVAEPDLAVSIAVTPLAISSVGGGVWRISTRTRIVIPGSISSALQVTVTWSEGGVTQSESGANLVANLTTTREGKTFVIRPDANTPISYIVVYANGGGAQAMHYSLDVTAELVAADGV